jgi:peptidyl-prolyl cis-trans isomerase B (cyclophilin B)
MGFLLILGILSLANLCYSQEQGEKTMANSEKTENPIVELKTTMGTIKIELFAEKAPITVKNFLGYVNEGFYNNTIFHRVKDGFMVQGGGFTKDMKQKQVKAPIVNEAENGLKNSRGTIAMARTSDVNSATAQFFINVVDNSFLDFKAKNSREYGYCVFGKVIEGMDVVDKIKKARTGSHGPHQDVPLEVIEITDATQLN